MIDDDLTRKIASAKSGVIEYQLCDCYALGKQPLCGCGKHNVRMYRDHVIHWLGYHWEIECAFKHAIVGLSQAFGIFKYMDDRGIV
jgi:hypothetical protein